MTIPPSVPVAPAGAETTTAAYFQGRADGQRAEWKRITRELLERHRPTEDSPGWGSVCGVCWVRGGSRATWPCPESIAIADLIGPGQ